MPGKAKTPKGAPKLKRSGRTKQKYAAQYTRTHRNKLRRIRRSNGPEAAQAWAASHPSYQPAAVSTMGELGLSAADETTRKRKAKRTAA